MLTRLKDRAGALWRSQRSERAWLDHAVRAWTQLSKTNGGLLAGALTFFSFLSLFPLILLAVSVAGFVFSANPELEQRLFDKIAEQAPGQLGDTIKASITAAVNAKASLGIVAVLGLLLTGLGWINNLRQATEQVWGHPPQQRSFLAAKSADLVVLVGLGLGLLFSVALTAGGTALSGILLRAVNLDDAPGARWLTTVIGLAIAVVADLAIFGFLIVRLPRATVGFGLALRGTVLMAVGFEILKLFGTYYIARVASSPTVGAFGSIIGILVWFNLVFRYLLYCTAWTATGAGRPSAVQAGLAPVGLAPVGVAVGAPGGGRPGRPSGSAAATPPPRRGVAWALALGALVRRRR